MRLIDQGGIESLTTNVIAASAGVSIGTLYQYFNDKQAILDALIKREMTALSTRVLETLKSPPPESRGGRIPTILRAVFGSYGGRRRVHRLILQYALTRPSTTGLAPFFAKLIELFASETNHFLSLSRADAFVLTYAFVGVMRALVINPDQPSQQAVEESLTRLVVNFVEAAPPR